MIRYVPSFQLGPSFDGAGDVRLWVGYSIWDDDQCLKHVSLYNELLEGTSSCTDAGNLLAFALELTDKTYQSISANLERHVLPSISETNARPSDTTVPQ
jgi:hypothetical protein